MPEDVAAERAVLAGICTYGMDAYLDVSDLVGVNSFTIDSNQNLWKCLQLVLENSQVIDYPSILSSANALGLGAIFERPEEQAHLRAVMNFPVEMSNVRRLAARIKKLEFLRHASKVVDNVKHDINSLSGDEPVMSILSKIENPILDISSVLTQTTSGPQAISVGLRQYIEHLETNKRDMVGLSSGFPIYDFSIGGGFRPGTVNVIGARPKTGKAQPLKSTVFTPYGPTTMGQIKVGDVVCGLKEQAKVIAIHPQGMIDTYRVKFHNGHTVECCMDHLWFANGKVVSLREIVRRMWDKKGDPKWKVKRQPVQFIQKKKLAISPIRVGTILSGKNISGLTANVVMSTVKSWRCVPNAYKYSSLLNRLKLLKGFCSGAGSYDRDGTISIVVSNGQIVGDLSDIVHSLGGYAYVSNPLEGSYKISFSTQYNHLLIKGCPEKKVSYYLKIVKVEYIGKQECQCITLDNSNGIYYTDNCVPTHNSMLAMNIGMRVAAGCGYDWPKLNSENQVPVLSLDTEMVQTEQWDRMTSLLSGVPIRDIETGKFNTSSFLKKRVYDAIETIEKLPYDFLSIAGQPFEETESVMRRWVSKRVGLNDDGSAKPCLIIFDYLKLMSSESIDRSMAEFQVLGF
jgi:replicative DNA helicase